MQTKNHTSDNSSSLFLTGALFLANLDYMGLMEYAIKAAIGGVIWMVFKLGTDFISEKRKKK